jgi:hypothetical protein
MNIKFNNHKMLQIYANISNKVYTINDYSIYFTTI